MIIKTQLLDINGHAIDLGDKVTIYKLDHQEVGREGDVVEVDITKPLPIADVPLAVGVVEFCKFQLALIVRITEFLSETFNHGVASISMGMHSYAYELTKD